MRRVDWMRWARGRCGEKSAARDESERERGRETRSINEL